MRKSIPLDCQAAHNPPARKPRSRCAQACLALFAASTFLFSASWPSAAQTPAAQARSAVPTPAAAHKPAHPHKRSAAHPLVSAPLAAPEKPVEPEAPHWPVNDKPADASVTWDSQGLRIEAQNSSLQQILNDVAAATGATVEGLDTDERVFGAYGPGQARDVLSKLLEGSGYNIMMIGDQGQGTPRQIVLTSRNGAAKEPAPGEKQPAAGEPQSAASDEDPEADEQPEAQPQPRPRPGRPGFGPGNQPGGPPRSPQQILQELQQRQQNQPPPQPPGNPQN